MVYRGRREDPGCHLGETIAKRCKHDDGKLKDTRPRQSLPPWGSISTRGKDPCPPHRLHQMGGIGRRLGQHAFRTGIIPATTYGATVTYPSAATIKQMRSYTSGLLGPTKSASTTARLAIQQCDPERDIVERTTITWASALWDNSIEAIVAEAWRQAISTQAQQKPSRAPLFGVAGAHLTAIARL